MDNSESKKAYFIGAALALAVSTALLRWMNIYNSRVATDISYSDAYSNIINYSHIFLSLAVVGFAIAFVVYCAWMKTKRTAVLSATVASAVYFLDRAFCTVYDVARGNIAIENSQKLETSIVWMTVDFLFYAVTFFGAFFITLTMRKKLLDSHNGEADFFRYNPSRAVLYSVGIISGLQLASQLVICIQFIAEYDDITKLEYLQMGTDVILTLAEYGLIVFAFATVFRLLFFAKREKK